MNIINTTAYQFIALDQLDERRQHLLEQGNALSIKGTIILSPEGINCAIAGETENMRLFKQQLQLHYKLPFKDTYSDILPFKRFLVKIKPEIITFRRTLPEVSAPYVDAKTLKKWLDGAQNVVLLDTRNRFELRYGKFEHAIDLGIDNFSEFSEAIAKLPEALKSKTLVTYCTGGVRCEKAAPLLQQQGFKHVYQIEGGLLKYFELCGGAHYQGNCFVFDERISLSPSLSVSGEISSP
jgi:UPF0176 protein